MIELQKQSLYTAAEAFARERHAGQKRKDATARDYICHPLRVAVLLRERASITDEEILAAAVLHDTLEDTRTTLPELTARFGARVAAMVAEVTDDKSIPKLERKGRQIHAAASLSRGAALIRAADKIANVEDLLNHPPVNWPPERLKEYVTWAGRVVQNLSYRDPALAAAFSALLERASKKFSNFVTDEEKRV